MKIEEGFQRWGIELIDEEEEEEAMESGLREEEWRGKLVLVNWHLEALLIKQWIRLEETATLPLSNLFIKPNGENRDTLSLYKKGILHNLC